MIGVLASGKTSVLAGQFITQNFPVLGSLVMAVDLKKHGLCFTWRQQEVREQPRRAARTAAPISLLRCLAQGLAALLELRPSVHWKAKNNSAVDSLEQQT